MAWTRSLCLPDEVYEDAEFVAAEGEALEAHEVFREAVKVKRELMRGGGCAAGDWLVAHVDVEEARKRSDAAMAVLAYVESKLVAACG